MFRYTLINYYFKAGKDNIRKNLAEIIGFFVVQIQIISYFHEFCNINEHQELWNEMLSNIEKSMVNTIF